MDSGPIAVGLLALLTFWAAAALYFDVRIFWLRVPLAVIYGLGMLVVWVRVRRPWKAIITAAGFVLVLGWWLSLKPSNDRDWQPDVAVLPYADIAGNQVTIHNIRNCDYHTETNFDVHYYDRTFDLDALRTVDLYLVTWGSPNIAHTMVSFGFTNGDYVCFSIETRKQKGQDYSAVKGLFRQFELTYIVADERDLVRLRTNYRQGEEACLYRLRMTPAQGRTLFLDYLRRVNELRDQRGVVQRRHRQLHDRHPHPARRRRPRAVGLADADQRAPRRIALRTRGDRHQPAVRGIEASRPTSIPKPERRTKRLISRNKSAKVCLVSVKPPATEGNHEKSSLPGLCRSA